MGMDPEDAMEVMKEEDERDDMVEHLSAEWLAIKHAIKPIRDWYESDEHPPREVSEIVADAVTDLQADRTEILRLRKEILSSIGLTRSFAVRVREGGGPEDVAASLAVSVSKLYGEYERLLTVIHEYQCTECDNTGVDHTVHDSGVSITVYCDQCKLGKTLSEVERLKGHNEP